MGDKLNKRNIGKEANSTFRQELRIFLFITESRPALGPTQPPIQWVKVKRPGREAGHSPPSSEEVNNAWSYTSTPHTPSWRGAQLKIHRDNLTFHLLITVFTLLPESEPKVEIC
jgi:hypothetical protein